VLERLLRQLLWVAPASLAIALLTFYLLAFVPPEHLAQSSPHARFRSLPVFFNPAPADLRGAVEKATHAVLAAEPGSARASVAEANLVELGGAALPHVLPTLDAHAPEDRLKLVLAFAPLAKRMQLERAEDAALPDKALRFWTRFWEANEVEFRLATARSVVRRWVLYGDVGREREVSRLDTFALEALIEALPPEVDEATLERSRRVVAAIAHVTASDDRIAPSASPLEGQACASRWRRFWIAHRTRYVQLRGSDRIAAFVLESRFGKWAEELLSTRTTEATALERLQRRAMTTLSLVFGGWLFAVGAGIVGGCLVAGRGTRTSRDVGGLFAMVLFAVTLPGVAIAMASVALGVPMLSFLLAALTLAGSVVARPFLSTNVRVTRELDGDVAAGARARGGSRSRHAWSSGLRATAGPIAAEVLLDLPFSITAAFVIERAFQFDGLGAQTLEAVATGEVGSLMLLAAIGTSWGGLALLASDAMFAVAVPRARGALLRLGSQA